MKCWLTTTNYWENLSEKINKKDVMEVKRKYQKLCGKQQENSYELLPYHSRVVNFHHISDLKTEVVRERRVWDTAMKALTKITGENLQDKLTTAGE